MKPIFFLLTSLLLAFCQARGQNGWFWQYPKPQGNTLHEVLVFDRNTAIAAGDMGTLIKTIDGGVTWEVQHHVAGVSQDIYDLYFWDRLSGWAVGSRRERLEGGILLSTEDGGENWTALTSDSAYSFGAVHFVNTDTGWVFGSSGLVMKTTNGGNTWNRTIIYTIDDAPNLGAADFVDEQTGWVVGNGFYGNSVYMTTDAGDFWFQLTNINPIVFGSTNVQFLNKDTGWVVGFAGSVINTLDGGASWTHQRQGDDNLYSVHFVNEDTGWVVGGVVQGVGGRGIALLTTDGGLTWNEQSIQAEAHLYSIDFEQDVGWTVGRDGAIYRTTDAGSIWIGQREDKFSFNSIQFINENLGWAVGEAGAIYLTENGGQSWKKQAVCDSMLYSSVCAIDSQDVFAAGAVLRGSWPAYSEHGILSRSTDGGKTWQTETYDTLGKFSAILFLNDSSGWIGVTDGTLLKTNDRGSTWEQSCTGLGNALDEVQFMSESTGWVSYSGGSTLLKTTDGGVSWSPQLVDTNLAMYSFHFANANVGWAVGAYNGEINIFKTTNSGNDWTPCGTPPAVNYYSVYFVNDSTGFAAGYDNVNQRSVIIGTKDGGGKWFDQKSPSTGQLFDLYFINETTGWAAGDGILGTTNGVVVSVHNQPRKIGKSVPGTITPLHNYPNPFNPRTIIAFQMSRSDYVSLEVYDLLGRLVSTLIKEWMIAGEHEVSWEPTYLPSGVYFCRLRAGDSVESRRMVLIR